MTDLVVVTLADLETLLDRKLKEHLVRLEHRETLLTLEQAAERTQLHPKTLARYLRGDAEPKLEGRRIGNRWRISERSLVEWTEANDGD